MDCAQGRLQHLLQVFPCRQDPHGSGALGIPRNSLLSRRYANDSNPGAGPRITSRTARPCTKSEGGRRHDTRSPVIPHQRLMQKKVVLFTTICVRGCRGSAKNDVCNKEPRRSALLRVVPSLVPTEALDARAPVVRNVAEIEEKRREAV